jgi:Flp pilus assembly protein TadG
MLRPFRSNSKRGVITVFMTLMLPFLLLPAAGLAIDATITHIVQTKLQAAVDAAALGSGRLLGTSANITEIAGEFFNANFTVGARGLWGATLPNPGTNPTITFSNGLTKTITVNATANVPTLFMRILGYSQAQVSAVGTATRRDARFILVLDRSGSMSSMIASVETEATSIIKGFRPGLDEVGVVVFDGSAVVGYPSTNSYSTVVSSTTGGPDTSFWDSSTGGKSTYPQDAVYQTNAATALGGTGMSDALGLAYIELQKAHLHDISVNGKDDKMNAILLFTDGVPSALSIYANDPSAPSNTWLKSSNCTYATNTGGTHPINFWMVNSGSPKYSSFYSTNNYELASADVNSTNTPNWWMTNPNQEPTGHSNVPNESGCTSNLDGGSFYSYLKQIPTSDRWGNATTANTDTGYASYQDSYIISNGAHVTNTSKLMYDGSTALDLSSVSSPYQWGLAMWDAVDNAAYNIRTDANFSKRTGDTAEMYIQVFAIGYSGNGGTDAGLLKRVAYDPSNTDSPNTLPSGWSAQPQGKFCLANNPSEMANCFGTIGSILLRLIH